MACVRSLALAGATKVPSLWALTCEAIELGVYRREEDGRITGAFHKPLIALLQRFGIQAALLRHAGESCIWKLSKSHPIILSIDLAAAGCGQGGHLILVVGRSDKTGTYEIHDNASVIATDGASCWVTRTKMAQISNGKGLVIESMPERAK